MNEKDTKYEIGVAIKAASARQIKFDNGVIEILGLMAKHLATRNALDLDELRAAIEEQVRVCEAPSDDHSGGGNCDKAMALRLFLGATANPPASPLRTVN